MAVRDQMLHCPRCLDSRPLPSKCPECKGVNLIELGIGIDGLCTVLKALFPSATVQSLSKDIDLKTVSEAQILVATQSYLDQMKPIQTEPLGLIALIDADQTLYIQDTRSIEETIRAFEQWRGVALNTGARFVVQTHEPELFSTILGDPEALLSREWESCRDYGLPPFRRWVRISRKEEEVRKLEVVFHQLQKELATIPTVRSRKPELVNGGMQFFCSVEPEHAETLLSFFTDLPDHYIIDTNVFP